MGIRGLTTFINNRAHLYLQDYELHSCNVVIDGNSIASNLYKWHCKSNDCFGGDYDKFANVIRKFFEVLQQCNITPYVILDGGYEKRKLNTVISRMKNKIRAAEALNAFTEGSDSVFPLFLREVFVDIVISLGIKLARCEFEGDMEIAGIAKALDCPVLSYDSDFYIFGCLYIPFSTVEIIVRKGKNKLQKNAYDYLACKMYQIENFLQAFGGLDRQNLPLFSVLLGNDYVNGKLFIPFFRNLKIQKCSGNQSDQQKRIKSVIVWLQNETMESAIKKVLSRFKDKRRQVVLRQIKNAMKGYFEVDSQLLQYLGIEPITFQKVEIDFEKLTNEDVDEKEGFLETDENESSYESDNEPSMDCESDSDAKLMEDPKKEADGKRLSNIFYKNYRNCQYPACLMDMITLHRYYCIPQVEDSTLEHSHTISLDILNIIYKILTPNQTRKLKIVCRSGKSETQFVPLHRIEKNIPTLEDIDGLDEENRKLLLFKLLDIDNKVTKILELFPKNWHLFLISLTYVLKKQVFDTAIIHSCIMCFFILNCIDPKIGFYRVSKTFDKKFAAALSKIKSEDLQDCFISFNSLSFNNCLLFMDKMISFFQMDVKLKTNYRLYDKTLVHSLSQIQSVLYHIKYLNSVLNLPFPSLEIHKIFDGTFLFNMAMNLRKRTVISDYFDLFLKECPQVLNCLNHIWGILSAYFEVSNYGPLVRKHRKKKRKKKVEYLSEEIDDLEQDEEMEGVLDPNNPYSVLAVV